MEGGSFPEHTQGQKLQIKDSQRHLDLLPVGSECLFPESSPPAGLVLPWHPSALLQGDMRIGVGEGLG